MSKEEEFKKALIKLFSELNGKTMDYETCRMIEDGIIKLFEETREDIKKEIERIFGKVELCSLCKKQFLELAEIKK